MTGLVYVVRLDNGLIKIGQGGDIKRAFAGNNSYGDVEQIAHYMTDDPVRDERIAHQACSMYRARNDREWFNGTAEQITGILGGLLGPDVIARKESERIARAVAKAEAEAADLEAAQVAAEAYANRAAAQAQDEGYYEEMLGQKSEERSATVEWDSFAGKAATAHARHLAEYAARPFAPAEAQQDTRLSFWAVIVSLATLGAVAAIWA